MANQLLYGFHNLLDVKTRLIDDVGITVVNTAVTQAFEQYNKDLDALLNLFVTRTTEYQVRFRSTVKARLQPLDENGRARPIKAFGYYQVAFPIQQAGSAWGVDYVASKKMTVQDANDASMTMMTADTNWVRDHLLAGLLYSTNPGWTFPDDKHGDLIIKGLANGDTDKYQLTAGANAQATANHYLAQAADISDAANPFPTIHKRLTEHPENVGEVIVLVASNLTEDIKGLAGFIEKDDPDIRRGANVDALVGNLDAQVPGEIIGKVDKCWIVEWAQLPDGYMTATTTAGDRPLAMREDEEAILRGFKKVAERNDHPFYESQYLRRCGFGAWNRVGALVYFVGDASYAIPSGYESPMW